MNCLLCIRPSHILMITWLWERAKVWTLQSHLNAFDEESQGMIASLSLGAWSRKPIEETRMTKLSLCRPNTTLNPRRAETSLLYASSPPCRKVWCRGWEELGALSAGPLSASMRLSGTDAAPSTRRRGNHPLLPWRKTRLCLRPSCPKWSTWSRQTAYAGNVHAIRGDRPWIQPSRRSRLERSAQDGSLNVLHALFMMRGRKRETMAEHHPVHSSIGPCRKERSMAMWRALDRYEGKVRVYRHRLD